MNVEAPNIFIDHINGNIFDNRKENLRISDCEKNAQNKSKTKSIVSSKYIGVSHNKKSGKWHGTICLKNKTVYFASDIDEIFSARRRDIYIMENLKDTHFKLNFNWTDNEIIEWKEKLNYKICSTPNFYGISHNKKRKFWKGRIQIKNKIVYCKCDKDELIAARRRDIFILENLKDTQIKLNFTWTQDEINEWKTKLIN